MPLPHHQPSISQRKPAKKKPQRVRITNKALESRQFSTVRLPRASEAPTQKVDVQSLHRELADGGGAFPAESRSKEAISTSNAAAPSVTSSTFDPIIHDAMFTVVFPSRYWPPPTMEELHAKTGLDHGDGFDSYDRRADDKQAKKERIKVVKGELNHPRGKPRQNVVVRLSGSSSDEEGAEGEAEE